VAIHTGLREIELLFSPRWEFTDVTIQP